MAAGADTPCPSCGRETPGGVYCAHCGALLHPAAGERGGHSPPRRTSTCSRRGSSRRCFPHLPLRSHNTFRALLGTGVLLIGLSSLAGLFPVALIAAAVLVPLLVVLYLREGSTSTSRSRCVCSLSPSRGSGGGAGRSAFLATRSRAGGGAGLADDWACGALERCPAAADRPRRVLVGPLVLLRYRNFNDVLDGVTFGGAAAVTFAGAELAPTPRCFSPPA